VPSSTELPLPQGFRCYVNNIGIKDGSDDFVLIVSDTTSSAAGVFTQSRFAGPSVSLSRRAVADGQLRAFAVISKNANVANGKRGADDADEVVRAIAHAIGCQPLEVLLASTGVIGRPYPMEKLRSHLGELSWPPAEEKGALAAATGIMTTDTVAKVAVASVGNATVVGIAKGVGMIEPNMATLITMFLTDARISAGELRPIFTSVIDRTFNCLSIDTDTSTSDTAAIMANGRAGFVDRAEFADALEDVALSLTKQIARDGEGATKLIEVTVQSARDHAQAKRVAKSIVNSPLVKTAIHGADPNWGRVAMAIGKCEEDTDIMADRVAIQFGDHEVYPTPLDAVGLAQLAATMSEPEIQINVSLRTGSASCTVYGCDLSDGYVHINADYTT
jgi:glutamate N-acetyltransferase / amino-acid N-acetyltransferase